MPRSIPAPRAICAALAGACALAHAAATSPAAAPTRAASESYFGTTVTDSYRYMEDLSAPEVRQWAHAQADFARATLDAIPGRAALLARIRELESSVQARVTEVKLSAGDLVFLQERGAGDEQSKLVVRKGMKGADRVLVDPQALAKAGGKPQAIEFFEPSHDGRFVAYGLSAGGSEQTVIHLLDVASGKELMAPIDRAQYSDAQWAADDSGFFYLRQRALAQGAPESEKFIGQSAFFHRVAGRGPDQAVLVAGTSEHLPIAAADFPYVAPIAGTRWAVAIPGNGVANEFDLYAAPQAQALDPKLKWRKLFGREAEVTGFAIHGDDLYLLTHLSASRFKVLQTSMTHPDLELARVVVAPSREVIDNIVAAKDALYVQVRDGVAGRLYRVVYTKDAQPVAVTMPVTGAIRIVDADLSRPGVIVAVDSWTHDTAYWRVGARDDQIADTGLQVAGQFGAPADIAAREVLVKSYDGLEIPLSIVYPKDMKLDGKNPLELHAYGAYAITTHPSYLPRELAWYELGGVQATCHVRGGGVYGEQWHLAGKGFTKPNTWKDLIACGEYLVKEGYTSAGKMALDGRSAGGIAVGRAMTERPDLWAVVVPEAGALNTLREELQAGGPANIPEFGSVKDKQQFNGLLEMDSFHHVADGVKYPATLLVQGYNDSRVSAWESMKMAARLQSATASGRPVLLRLDFDAGHGRGATKTQQEEQLADKWSFMLWQFGDSRFQPAGK
jgi:prolyl oligopeptidase